MNMTGKVENRHSWIIESGASYHITYLIEWSKSMKNKNPYVTIPNGKLVRVEGIGDIQISKRYYFENVLKLPDFNCKVL